MVIKDFWGKVQANWDLNLGSKELGFSYYVYVVRDNSCIIPVMTQTKTIIVEIVKLVNSASVNLPQNPIEILLFLPQGLKYKKGDLS